MIRHLRRMGLPSFCLFIGIASFLFPQAQIQVGYTLLTADAGTSVPVGTALFTVTNSQGVLVSQAGVGAAEPVLSGRIFVDETGPLTGIALVNPSQQDASVTLILRDSKGQEVGRTSQPLAAGKHIPTFVYQLFKNLPASFTGSLTFESNRKIAAIALRQNLNAAGEPLYTTLPVADPADMVGSQSLFFPQIAAGGGYATQLLLINTTSQILKGAISLTDSEGKPLPYLSNGISSSQISYSIDPQGTFRAELDRSGETKAGYALLVPDAGLPPPSGSSVFQFRKGKAIVTEAAVAATTLTSSARIFVDNVASFTGVALANPSAQSALVTFTLVDRYGSTLDSTTRTLPAKGHLAIFAHELFPSLPGTFTGLMEINSPVPVAPITLKLVINQQNDLILTTLPVADLTRPPTATSVVFPHIAIGGGFSTRLICINTDKAKTIFGSLAFFKSDSSAMTVPLGGKTDSRFVYQLTAGGGRQLLPGNTAALASISLLDPSTYQIANEIVVNQGQSLRAGVLALDETGLPRDDFDITFSSLSTDVASVDTTGNIQANKAGFSTLTLACGNVFATGTITVVSISSGTTGFDITGIAQDLSRRLYLTNTREHAILLAQDLKQTPATYAGVPKSGGLKDDARLRALFRNPSFVVLDQAQASLFVSDTENHVIRKVNPGATDKVETVAGMGAAGSADGAALRAGFNRPQGLALDGKGFLWVADSGNHTIRRLNLASGEVETVAGKAGTPGWADGSRNNAIFSVPAGIAIETESLAAQLERERKNEPPPPVSILVADKGNGVIRRVKETGEVETLRAGGQSSAAGIRIGVAPRAAAGAPVSFSSPTGIAVDSLGNIYVSEPGSGRLRVILSNGEILPATAPKTLVAPWGVVITQSGKVMVADHERAAQEISYAEPRISGIAPSVISNKGGDKVTISGSNFAPESLVVIAGVLVPKVEYRDSRTISFVAPAVPSGRGTLTVQHRGGLAQRPIAVEAVPLNSLSAGQITTIAGGATFAGDGSAATAARLALPVGVAIDKAGNIFIADHDNNRIRKISATTGIITSVAGSGLEGFDGDNGLATAAALKEPTSVALDSSGNLLIADSGNYRIRRVSADSAIITTVAGGGEPQDRLGDNGPATGAELSVLHGIALDQDDNFYIADAGNNRIRKVDARTKIISTIAGTGTLGFSGDNGPASGASLDSPERLAFDAEGNLYIADTGNCRVRKVDAATGIISTIAGNGRPEHSGDLGLAKAAQLRPGGIAVDVNGNIFVADTGSGQWIRKIEAATKIISTVAGGGSSPGDGGPATEADLRFLHGIGVDGAGNLLIAESGNHRIRKVSALTQIITTLAGGTLDEFLGDGGPATAASLGAPLAAVPDAAGNIYIADTEHNRIRRIDAATRNISTFAGTGEETFSGNGGPAQSAAFVAPSGVALDSSGNVFFCASGNSMVLKVDIATGILTIAAGDRDREGFSGDSGPATLAGLNFPSRIAIDAGNNLFIADAGNNRIRRVDATSKIISTVAGGGAVLGDGGLAIAAALDEPHAIAIDKQGNLYIADTSHHRIRKVGTNGIITTIAGNGNEGFSGDGGLATAAQISSPRCVALDDAGNLYMADGNGMIRRVDARTSIITTVAGVADLYGVSGDNGPAAAAALAFPYGVSLDLSGNLYIADTYNHRVRAVRGPLE